VEASHHLILLGSALVLLSIFAGVFSARFGAPLLLVFLGLGILAGEEGPGGILFRDFHAAYLIGSVALAIILFDGGLRTDPSDIRRALWPSLALATVGVILTAAIVGVAAVLLFSTSWTRGLLIGAIVAPTDAAAVSALLHLRRLELRARVAALLEVESGINDPVSVLIAVLLVELLVAPVPLPTSHIVALAAREIVGGAAFGIGGGYLLLALVNRLEATTGLYPILALAGSTALFGAAQTAGASGFLAVYLAGLILGGHRHRATQVINQAFDAFAWLSQIVLFLMLGLLVTPSALIPILGPSRALLSSSADPADRTLAIDFAGADGDALPVEALNAALLSNHADLVRAAATYIAHQPTAFAYQFEQPLLKGQVLKSDETKPASLRT
jgi:potassium/hydrogen antiporter